MKPLYLLTVDPLGPKSMGLIIRGNETVTGEISLPDWEELPAAFDGPPHEIAIALRLANDYAEAYGYFAIMIDIESSQLWQPEWGDLVTRTSLPPTAE